MCINPFKALGLGGGGSPAHMLPQHKQQVAAPVPRQDYITPEESALLKQDQMMADAARMGTVEELEEPGMFRIVFKKTGDVIVCRG